MNKQQLIEALVEKGFDAKELEALTVPKLKELIKLQNDEENEDEDEGTDENQDEDDMSEDEDEDEDEGTDSGKEVDIVKGDEYIRTFSEGVHGKDFKKLAKMFIEKNPKMSISKKNVKEVVVRWRAFDKELKAYKENSRRFSDKEMALEFKNTDGTLKKVIMVAK